MFLPYLSFLYLGSVLAKPTLSPSSDTVIAPSPDGIPENDPAFDQTVDYALGLVDGIPLPGDLATLNFTTPVGLAIAQMLEINITAQADTTVIDPSDTTNPCYIWWQISNELTTIFLNSTTGLCTDNARAAVRAGFHDAGAYSVTLAAQGQDYGGADGSLFLFDEAILRPENDGLQEITSILGNMAIRYGVGVGDMFQFAASHATVSCPQGPRMRTFVGRPDATQAAPMNLLPSAFSNATVNVELFKDKGISGFDLIALIGAHTVSKQFTTIPATAGQSQDSTPGVWDVKFYAETIVSQFETGTNITTFPSDLSLSLYSPLQAEFDGYAGNQADWQVHYSRAYVRLSLTGVKNIQGMTECSSALPLAVDLAPPENPEDCPFCPLGSPTAST